MLGANTVSFVTISMPLLKEERQTSARRNSLAPLLCRGGCHFERFTHDSNDGRHCYLRCSRKTTSGKKVLVSLPAGNRRLILWWWHHFLLVPWLPLWSPGNRRCFRGLPVLRLPCSNLFFYLVSGSHISTLPVLLPNAVYSLL